MFLKLFKFVFLFSVLFAFQMNATASSGSSSDSSPGQANNANKALENNDTLNALVVEAEKIKNDIIQINQELYKFQEELLYPTNTQVAVFLSYADKTTFILDSVEINLDGKLVSSGLYRDSEIDALKKGGIQRIYLGSLSDGKHKLSMQFNGQGQNERYFRRKKLLSFVKEEKAKYIQLIVSDNNISGEPLFKVKQW